MIDTASKNAVPIPLRELGDEPSNRRERRQGDRHLRALHPWCNVIEDPTHGEATSVAIHGPWSVGRGRASGSDLQGRRFEVYTGLAHFYAHGTYASGSLARPVHHEAVVRLSLHGKGIKPDPWDGE